MDNKTCDTIPCKATATHRLTWPDWNGRPVHESVCEPCGKVYMNRAQFRDVAKLEPLSV